MVTVPARRRRRGLVAFVLLAALFAVVAAATVALFIEPVGVVAPAAAPATDAVVVMSGSERSRLPAGEAIAERHPEAVVVVSTDEAGADDACTPPGRVCFEPDPFATRGEARAIAALAAERGWESVAVVTSTYHLARSRMLVRQCFDGDVVMVDAGHGGRSKRRLAEAVAREWVAYGAGLTVQRAC